MVEYVYDSWGNHAIVGENGETVTEGIGVLNPYRYRGYYYDAETGLYYLQTRYYDPEIGRFISQDSIEYADPETINGLNLYAYCNNNPVMNVDPTGEFFLSFLIVGIVGAISAAVASMVVQVATTGEVDWAQVGISALFGAVSGILSFTGIGGVIGQFVIQGALAVGEMYSIAALNGTASLIGPEEVVATFLFAGVLGTIGSGSAADNFKHVTKIEGAFTKYSFRDIFKKSKPIFSTLLKRGAKYLGEFVKPLIKQTMVLGFVTAVVSTLNYWVQKVYDAFN